MKKMMSLWPFFAGWGLLLCSTTLSDISLINGTLQILLFAVVVCIPTWKTGRMSYVDIGWPWGLVLIGVLTFIFSEGHWLRKALVSSVYLFIGLRMGLGAIKLLKIGHLDKELPRYQYQQIRWQRAGITHTALAKQIEVIMQGIANASFLAMPAFIIASNPSNTISIFEIVGLVLWVCAFAMESTADAQKLAFLKVMRNAGEKKRVCNIGLWRFSRHPNYFAEWMVWNALIIAAIPSWVAMKNSESMAVWLLLGGGVLFVSRVMYTTLVHYTGAKPSEYYSVQKRPEYADYQKTTNMFFPGKPKHLPAEKLQVTK